MQNIKIAPAGSELAELFSRLEDIGKAQQQQQQQQEFEHNWGSVPKKVECPGPCIQIKKQKENTSNSSSSKSNVLEVKNKLLETHNKNLLDIISGLSVDSAKGTNDTAYYQLVDVYVNTVDELNRVNDSSQELIKKLEEENNKLKKQLENAENEYNEIFSNYLSLIITLTSVKDDSKKDGAVVVKLSSISPEEFYQQLPSSSRN